MSAAVVAAARPAPAAPPQAQVTAAVDRGVAYLKDGLAAGGGWGGSHGIGPPALTGIALIEAQLPATDPTIQAIAAAVRKAALTEGKTYQASLCLLFLDKLEDPADVPLIQVLACRLLAGQKPSGVWEYTCPADPLDAPFVAALTEKKLGPGLKDDKGNPQLHPLVAEYYGKLPKAAASQAGDHSNTQFGLLAVWASRKHGVPVEDALDRVAARFRDAQRRDGGWAYTTAPADNTSGSMTCAGLLGLSTYVARQEEKWAAARAGRREKEKEKQARDPSDPFVTREDGGGKKDRRPPDAVDGAVQAGFQGLGALFTGGGVRLLGDLYFLWSLERVGVIYGADKIGGVDWYDVGARFLLETQQRDGSWQATAGHRASPDVDTSFAVLFLLKANIARDLSSRVSGKGTTELRAGGGDPTPSGRARPVAPNKG
ncbi:MAG: hypothetical protein K2X82_25920, partial [Gemmataceae bacterium]|nr:hypothetical protein [Gemmataceae bacterium]